jgi:hypothetical protein
MHMHPLFLCLVVSVFQTTCSLTTIAFFLHHAPAVRLSSTRKTHASNTHSSSLRMGLLNNLDRLENVINGALFSSVEEPTKEDPSKELACFENLVTGKETETEMKAAYESLTNYLQLWAFALQQDPKAFATPITTSKFKQQQVEQQFLEEDGNNIKKSTSMKIIFRPPKRYLSYKEQKGLEKGVMPDRKGGKSDAWSPGGIQLTVQVEMILQQETAELRLVAKRCDIDGDTLIKRKSERAIIRRLNEAIRIWKKVRAMPTK